MRSEPDLLCFVYDFKGVLYPFPFPFISAYIFLNIPILRRKVNSV